MCKLFQQNLYKNLQPEMHFIYDERNLGDLETFQPWKNPYKKNVCIKNVSKSVYFYQR